MSSCEDLCLSQAAKTPSDTVGLNVRGSWRTTYAGWRHCHQLRTAWAEASYPRRPHASAVVTNEANRRCLHWRAGKRRAVCGGVAFLLPEAQSSLTPPEHRPTCTGFDSRFSSFLPAVEHNGNQLRAEWVGG